MMRDRLKSPECSKYLRAVADPERLKIIQFLQAGDKTVGVIAHGLGSSIANTSHHLKLLRQAGLVCPSKKGRFVSYSLEPKILRQSALAHASRARLRLLPARARRQVRVDDDP